MDGPDGIQPGLTYCPRSEEAALTLAAMIAIDRGGAVAVHCLKGLIEDRGRERVHAAFGRVPDNYLLETAPAMIN